MAEAGWNAGVAAAVVLAASLASLGAIFAALVPPFVDQLDDLETGLRQGVGDVGDWLLEGPVNLSERQLEEYVDRGFDQVRDNGEVIASGLFTGALIFLEVAFGLALGLVLTFFLLKDGERVWAWVVGLFPSHAREDLGEIGALSWQTLGGWPESSGRSSPCRSLPCWPAPPGTCGRARSAARSSRPAPRSGVLGGRLLAPALASERGRDVLAGHLRLTSLYRRQLRVGVGASP
ncbi:MAG: AI-2E family transporter [Thermoleophilaceae bacterium]|nr:AI-2E family transporter [Thermoleophilaceae bacterium]